MSMAPKEAQSILNKFGLLTQATAQLLLDRIENGTVTLNGGLTAPDAMEAVRIAAITSKHVNGEHYASGDNSFVAFNYGLAENLSTYQNIAREVGTDEFTEHMGKAWQSGTDRLAADLVATGVAPDAAAQAASEHLVGKAGQSTPTPGNSAEGGGEGGPILMDKQSYLSRRRELSHLPDNHPDVIILQNAYVSGSQERAAVHTAAAHPGSPEGAPSTEARASIHRAGKGGVTRTSNVMSAPAGRQVHHAGIRSDSGAGGGP